VVAQDLETILDKFFTRRGLKPWERPLESRARYNVLVWLAWWTYKHNYPEQAMTYLQRSLQHTPFAQPETIANWLETFRRFSLVENYPLDLNAFQQTTEWQKIVRQTLKIQS
jgi:hypothetical protein